MKPSFKYKVFWKAAANEIKFETNPYLLRLDSDKRYDMISEIDNDDVTYDAYYAQYNAPVANANRHSYGL